MNNVAKLLTWAQKNLGPYSLSKVQVYHEARFIGGFQVSTRDVPASHDGKCYEVVWVGLVPHAKETEIGTLNLFGALRVTYYYLLSGVPVIIPATTETNHTPRLAARIIGRCLYSPRLVATANKLTYLSI